MKNLYQEFKIHTGLGQPNSVYVGNQIKQCEDQIAQCDSKIASYDSIDSGEVIDTINQIDSFVSAADFTDCYLRTMEQKGSIIDKNNKTKNRLAKLEKIASGF
jgi:hypothetical protein